MKNVGFIISVLFLCVGVHAATVLYYNFEDGTPSVPMNNTGTNGQIGSLDISGNNRHMYAWNTIAGPWFSALGDTATGIGLSSRHNAQDGYCFDSGLVAWSPSVWTIEFSFKLDTIAGWRTLIGRDGKPGRMTPAPPSISRRTTETGRSRWTSSRSATSDIPWIPHYFPLRDNGTILPLSALVTRSPCMPIGLTGTNSRMSVPST